MVTLRSSPDTTLGRFIRQEDLHGLLASGDDHKVTERDYCRLYQDDMYSVYVVSKVFKTRRHSMQCLLLRELTRSNRCFSRCKATRSSTRKTLRSAPLRAPRMASACPEALLWMRGALCSTLSRQESKSIRRIESVTTLIVYFGLF